MNGEKLSQDIKKQLGDIFDIQDLKISLDNMVDKLNDSKQKIDKSPFANRFQKRSPIATIELSSRVQKKGKVNLLINLSNPNLEKSFRIDYDDILLLYDPKYDRLVSGRVHNIVNKKELVENNILIIVVELMYAHGPDIYEREPYKYVSPSTVAYLPTDEEIVDIFHIRDTGNNLKIGIVADSSFNLFKVNDISQVHHYPLSAIKRHMAVIGQTGVGKTIFLKNLMFELAQNPDVNLIIIDIEGDLLQMTEPADIENDYAEYPDAKILFNNLNLKERGLGNFLSSNEILFHVPDYFKKYTKKGFLSLYPWISFGLSSKNIEHGEELSFMLGGLSAKAKDGLHDLVTKYIETNPQNEFDLNTFLLFVIQNGRKVKTNYFWRFPGSTERIQMHEASYNSMIRELNSLNNLKLFDQTKGINFNEILNKRVVYFYLPHIRGFEKIRILTLYRLLTGISKIKFEQSLGVDDEDTEVKMSVFFVDEAHELLPNKPPGGMKDFFNIVNKEFSEIGREGRKKGLHLVYATQSMKDINQVVMKNANTKILFRLPAEDILNLSKNLKDVVISLKSQYAVIQLPDYPNSFLLRNFPPYFMHTDIADAYKKLKPKIQEIQKRREEYKKKRKKVLVEGEEEDGKKKKRDGDELLEDLPFEEVYVDELEIDELDAEVVEEESIEEEEYIPIRDPLEHHVTSFNGLSALQMSTKQIKDFLVDIFKSEGLIHDHLDQFLNSLSVALGNERVIGIALQGPPGEGKSKIIATILDQICIGQASCIRGLDSQTLEEELFFTENFMPFAAASSEGESKPQQRYNYGEICKSIFLKTCPVLEEANRVQSRFYSGPMFLALDDRRISFPGGKIVHAYPDWKVFLLMNFKSSDDLSFEMSVLPEALRDRIMFITVPYSPLTAVKKIIKAELSKESYHNVKVEDNVINILLDLREETIKRSPLPKHLIGDSYQVEEDPVFEFNGLSIRSILRMISIYIGSKSLHKSKEEALRAAIKGNCQSVYRSTEPDHYNELDRILDDIFNKGANRFP